MIKKFKIFEKYTSSSDLVDQFDDDFIDEWYDENYNIDAEEIASMSTIQTILDCFDDNEYKEDFIRDYVNSYDFSEIEKYDLKSFIEENLTGEKEVKILDIYNASNYDESDDITSDIDGIVLFNTTTPSAKKSMKSKNQIFVKSQTGEIKKYKIPKDFTILVEENQVVNKNAVLATGKETEFSNYMIDELDQDELRDVIQDSGEEEECTEQLINGWYSGQSGEDILEEFESIKDMDPLRFYKKFSRYIDDDKLIKDWKDGEDSTYKKEQLQERIYDTKTLQRYLIKKDPDNALALADLWEEERSTKTIGDEYKFQKGYIKKYVEDNIDETDEESRTSTIEDALQYLHENFGVHPKIEIKYEPYMWKITASKYNL